MLPKASYVREAYLNLRVSTSTTLNLLGHGLARLLDGTAGWSAFNSGVQRALDTMCLDHEL